MNSRSAVLLDGRIVDVDYESGMVLGRTDFLERAIGGEYQRTLGDQRGTLGVRVFATGYEAAINANVTDTRGVELSYARDMSELWSLNVSGGTQRSDFAYNAAAAAVFEARTIRRSSALASPSAASDRACAPSWRGA